MKISIFDFLICNIMRYKLTSFSIIVIATYYFQKGFTSILPIVLLLIFLLIDSWYNGKNLFDLDKKGRGFLKKRMYNKYNSILNFKYGILYNEISFSYVCIDFDNKDYYINNIYLFIVKTYIKEKQLLYEDKDNYLSLFIFCSKEEVNNELNQYLTVKVRKIHSDIRELRSVAEKYTNLSEKFAYYDD